MEKRKKARQRKKLMGSGGIGEKGVERWENKEGKWKRKVRRE